MERANFLQCPAVIVVYFELGLQHLDTVDVGIEVDEGTTLGVDTEGKDKAEDGRKSSHSASLKHFL